MAAAAGRREHPDPDAGRHRPKRNLRGYPCRRVAVSCEAESVRDRRGVCRDVARDVDAAFFGEFDSREGRGESAGGEESGDEDFGEHIGGRKSGRYGMVCIALSMYCFGKEEDEMRW